MKTRIIKTIGVGGPSGAGKTTVAKEIHKHHNDSIMISSDNYYKDISHLTLEERAETNFDHPDSIDFDLLATHLEKLKNGEAVDIPTYDFKTHSRTKETIHIEPKPIIIVEGILVLHPEKLASLLDFKIYVNADSATCLLRRIDRDVKERGRTHEGVIEQYKKTVGPMFITFVKPTSEKANLVIENTLESANLDVTPVIDFLKESKNLYGSGKVNISLATINGTLYNKSNLSQQPYDMESSKKQYQI